MSETPGMDQFLRFTAEMTAFTTFELRGTGQATDYLAAVVHAVGAEALDTLLAAFARAPQAADADQTAREAYLRREIFGDARLGPIARNIIKLWYVGIWYELPRAWIDAYGARAENTSFMVSASAYAEGLLWAAIGANPPGAKAPGYASWVGPPEIPSF